VLAGRPVALPMLDVHTVGAGGGSIAWRDSGVALRVGPQSAGASPGPACYGRGGTRPTVTDANLVLGVLPPGGLLDGTLPLDADAALAALQGLGEAFSVDAMGAAAAIHATVNANMAAAVREITVRHGIDPRECALIAFGGAGPQHAAGVAAELGIQTVVVPANCSVLSAVGLLTADVRVSAARTLLVGVEELSSAGVGAVFAELTTEATSRLSGTREGELLVERWAGLRYRDQWHEVALPVTEDHEQLVDRFEAEHERRFGTRLGDPVEAVDVWVTLVAPRLARAAGGFDPPASSAAVRQPRALVLADGIVSVLDRAQVGAERVPGPCLVEEGNAVTVVPTDSSVRVECGHLIIEAAA
jgi:N-methylhydantoinase A